MLAKHIEKKLDGKCTRMLWAILYKSWKQHPTKQQLYGHLSPISKIIQIRQTRHAGHCRRSKDKWCSSMDMPDLANQQERTYISFVRTQDVVWQTYQERWMIGMNGERERVKKIHASNLMMMMTYIYMYIYLYTCIYVLPSTKPTLVSQPGQLKLPPTIHINARLSADTWRTVYNRTLNSNQPATQSRVLVDGLQEFAITPSPLT